MSDLKYDFNVYPEFDTKIFKQVCEILTDNGCGEGKPYEDVDGSALMSYETAKGQIIVYNDWEVGAVYVKSDIDLKALLKPIMKAS